MSHTYTVQACIDERGNVLTMSAERLDGSGITETKVVLPVGPFDGWEELGELALTAAEQLLGVLPLR